jgi:hypothetical protein
MKAIKFAGIVIITAATIIWSKSEAMQRALKPALRVARLPMQAFAALVGIVILLITWPFKLMLRRSASR